MIIDEKPLGSRIVFETGVWGGSAYTWTDETSKIVSANYEEGGRLGDPGVSKVDTGNLNIVYRNIATVPAVGSLIRMRRSGTSEYIFTGYIQDVSNFVTYDFAVSNSPITLTTLYCLDWVGLASQFQLIGIGGKTSAGANANDWRYEIAERVNAINRFVDSTGATSLVNLTGAITYDYSISDTDMVGTLSEHLDLATLSTLNNWAATHVLPTNPTDGRDGLIEVFRGTSSGSSGKTFTDGTGLAGELHYTEIDFESSSKNIVNSIVARNRIRYSLSDPEVVISGGQDDKSYVEIDGQQRRGFILDTVVKAQNATSITTYGLRQAEINTCHGLGSNPYYGNYQNLCVNPSVEYSAEGYTASASVKLRRAQPSLDPNPFTTKNSVGLWALRLKITGNATSRDLTYDGTPSDGIPVVAGVNYVFTANAARGTSSSTDARARTQVIWYDVDDTVVGTSPLGSQVALTTANTWYDLTSGIVLAPANAVRASLNITYSRSGGGNLQSPHRYWADNFHLFARKAPSYPGGFIGPDYFDGDTPDTSTYLYFWTGSPGNSHSFREQNYFDEMAGYILAEYATTSNRITRIRWNAQEDLTAVSSLAVGKSVIVKYDGTTATYRIIGITGSLNYDRYVIDYYLKKI